MREDELRRRIKGSFERELRSTPTPPGLRPAVMASVAQKATDNRPRQWLMSVAALTLAVLVAGTFLGLRLSSQHGPARAPAKPTIKATSGNVPGPASLIAGVDFVSASVGWIALGREGPNPKTAIYGTSDAGRSWRLELSWPDGPRPGLNQEPVVAMKFFNAAEGFVVAPPADTQGPTIRQLYRTADGGASWQAVELPPESPWPGDLRSLDFISPDEGWVVSLTGAAAGTEAGAVYQTLDGGSHWTEVTRYGPRSQGRVIGIDGVAGIGFLNSSRGWLLPSGQLPITGLDMTTDGGREWGSQRLPSPQGVGLLDGELYPPQFLNSAEGLMPVIGYDEAKRGGAGPDHLWVFRTDDGGSSWRPLSTPGVFALGDSLFWQFLDGHDWVLGSRGTLWATFDGGTSWTHFVPGLPPGLGLTAIDFVDQRSGWGIAGGSYQKSGKFASDVYRLVRTEDGGHQWAEVSTPNLP